MRSGSTGGITVFSAVFIVLLVLKLTHFIDWSWWWVTVPLWGPLALVVAVLLLLGLAKLVIVWIPEQFAAHQRRHRARSGR